MLRHYRRYRCSRCDRKWERDADRVGIPDEGLARSVGLERAGVYRTAAAVMEPEPHCPACGCAPCYASCMVTDGLPWDEATEHQVAWFRRHLMAVLLAEWEFLGIHPRLTAGFHAEAFHDGDT